MKRFFTMLVCFTLLLTGCTIRNPETVTTEPILEPATTPTATQSPTTEPTTVPTETAPPVPDTLPATALADRIYVVLTTADRDALVEIVDTYDENYYVVKAGEGYGLIEKRLVRMDGEESYEGWTGYAVYQAKVYNNYYLFSGEEQTLNMNTKVQVIDNLDGTLVVQTETGIGYMRESELSRNYIQSTPSGGGTDGGDISLIAPGGVVRLSNFVPQAGSVSGKGTVLANGAEIVLGWFDKGDTVAIVNEEGFIDQKDGWYGIYHEGMFGYVRQNLVRKDCEEAYTEWDGFAKYQAQLFDNYFLNGEPVVKLASNASVHILEDLGHCYLVSTGEYTGYIAKDMVSETRINYDNGGGGSGGDWTPPAM